VEDTEPVKFRVRIEPPRRDPSKWSRQFTCLLAADRCQRCYGTGQSHVYREGYPCGCVTRRIFVRLLSRYHEIQAGPFLSASRNALRTGHPGIWSRKDIEFCADFVLLARRILTAAQLRIFEHYFLSGQDFHQCIPRLPGGYVRGTFFHEVYRVEQRVGHAARTLKPYALYPAEEYFRGPVQRLAKTTPVRRTF